VVRHGHQQVVLEVVVTRLGAMKIRSWPLIAASHRFAEISRSAVWRRRDLQLHRLLRRRE